jgi:hypothetical protein
LPSRVVQHADQPEIKDAPSLNATLKLAEPSQFGRSEVGKLFVFRGGTSKVSTTF